MNDKFVDFQSILEENSRLDSYVQKQHSRKSDNEIDLFHHPLGTIEYDNSLSDPYDMDADNPELLDLR